MQYLDVITNVRQATSGSSTGGFARGKVGKGTLVEPYSLPIVSAVAIHAHRESNSVERNYVVDNTVLLKQSNQDQSNVSDVGKHRCTVEVVEEVKSTNGLKKLPPTFRQQIANENKNSESDVMDSETERKRQFLQSRYPWRVLLLDHNRLSSIDSLGVFINLTKLDLSHNKLQSLPGLSFWSNFPKLQVLYLHHNRLDSITELKQLESLLKLVVLSVYGNPVECHPDYRHVQCNLLPNLCLLDFHIIADAELATSLTYDADKAPLSTAYECVLPQVNSTNPQEHWKLFKFEVNTVQAQRAQQSSIIRIQCWWRGIRVRRTIRELHRAAKTVQHTWRRWLQRKEAALLSRGYDVTSVVLTGNNQDTVKLQKSCLFYKDGVVPLSSGQSSSGHSTRLDSEHSAPHQKRQKDRQIELVDTAEMENSRDNVLALLTRTRSEQKLWNVFGEIKVDEAVIAAPQDIVDLETRVMRDLHVLLTNSPRVVVTLEIHGRSFKIARRCLGEGALHTVYSIIDTDLVLKLNKPYSLAVEKLQKEQDRIRQIQRVAETEQVNMAKVVEIDPFGMFMVCERVHGVSAVDFMLNVGLLERTGHNSLRAVSPSAQPALQDLPDVQSFRQEILRLMGVKQRCPGIIGDLCPTNLRVLPNKQQVVVGSSQVLTKLKATYAYAAQRGFVGYLQYAATSVGKQIAANVYSLTYEAARGTRMFVSDLGLAEQAVKNHQFITLKTPVHVLPSLMEVRNRSLYIVADSAKTLLSLALAIRHVQLQHGVAASPLCISGYSLLSEPSHTDDFPLIKVQRAIHGNSLPMTCPKLLYGPTCPGNANKALSILRPRGLTVPHADRLRKEIASALTVAHRQQAASFSVHFSNALQFPQPNSISNAIESVNLYNRQNRKSTAPQESDNVENEDHVLQFSDYMRPGESLVHFRDRLVRAAKIASPVRTQLLLLVCPSLSFLRDVVEQVHIHNFKSNDGPSTSPIYVYPHVTVRVMSAVLLIQSSWRAYLSRKRQQFPAGALVAIRRAQVCISRWWKVQQYKRRMFMLRGLMRYGAQIQDHILFMRSDVYHLLNSCPNDFVKKGFFPEHRVLVDVAVRTTKQRETHTISNDSTGNTVGHEELGLNELGDYVVMRNTETATKKIARSSLAVYSLPQIDYTNVPFTQHPSKSYLQHHAQPRPSSLTSRNSDFSGLQVIQESRKTQQVSGKLYMQEHSIYTEPEHIQNEREKQQSMEKTMYRFLPIPGWLLKSCGIHGMWLEQGPRQLFDYGEDHSLDDDDDGWNDGSSRRLDSLRKTLKRTVEKLEGNNWAALNSTETKMLKPWHYTLRDRLLNVLSVGVTVEVVPDASLLQRNETSELSQNFTDMRQYWIKLTFSSIQEARLRAMYLAMMTWDPVAHQSVALLLTAQKISQINQAYESYKQARPEENNLGVWTGGIEERLTIQQVLWYQKDIIQGDYITLIPPQELLQPGKDMSDIVVEPKNSILPQEVTEISDNHNVNNDQAISGESIGTYPEHILRYSAATGVHAMSSEEQKLQALKHSQENKHMYAQGQKLVSTLLQAQKMADLQTDLLANRRRNQAQRAQHAMKVQQTELRKAQVSAVRHQEMEEMKVYVTTSKAAFEAQRIGEAIMKKEERMRNRETYDVEKRIMLRDQRRQVMKQKEEDNRALEEQRDQREQTLFLQKQQRRAEKQRKEQSIVERNTASQFVSRQNMVLRQLQRGLLLRTKEVHQDRQNTHTNTVKERLMLGKEQSHEKNDLWRSMIRQHKNAHETAVHEALRAREHISGERIRALQAKREHEAAIKQGVGLSKDQLVQLPTPSVAVLRQNIIQPPSQPLQLPPITIHNRSKLKTQPPNLTQRATTIKPAPLLENTVKTTVTSSYSPVDYSEKAQQLAKQLQDQDLQAQPSELNIAAQTKAIEDLSIIVAERMNRLKTQRQ